MILCPVSGKVCHDRRKAGRHLASLRRRVGLRGGAVYRCNACGAYHVTSRPQAAGKRRTA